MGYEAYSKGDETREDAVDDIIHHVENIDAMNHPQLSTNPMIKWYWDYLQWG